MKTGTINIISSIIYLITSIIYFATFLFSQNLIHGLLSLIHLIITCLLIYIYLMNSKKKN